MRLNLSTVVLSLLGIAAASAAETKNLRTANQMDAETCVSDCFVPEGSFYLTCDYVSLVACTLDDATTVCEFTADCHPKNQRANKTRNTIFFTPDTIFTNLQNINGQLTPSCHQLNRELSAPITAECKPLVMMYKSREDAMAKVVCASDANDFAAGLFSIGIVAASTAAMSLSF